MGLLLISPCTASGYDAYCGLDNYIKATTYCHKGYVQYERKNFQQALRFFDSSLQTGDKTFAITAHKFRSLCFYAVGDTTGFKQELGLAVANGFSPYKDRDFQKISLQFFNSVVTPCRNNYLEKIEWKTLKTFDSIGYYDQRLRGSIFLNRGSFSKDQLDSIGRIMARQDRANCSFISNYIGRNGWPNTFRLDTNGNDYYNSIPNWMSHWLHLSPVAIQQQFIEPALQAAQKNQTSWSDPFMCESYYLWKWPISSGCYTAPLCRIYTDRTGALDYDRSRFELTALAELLASTQHQKSTFKILLFPTKTFRDKNASIYKQTMQTVYKELLKMGAEAQNIRLYLEKEPVYPKWYEKHCVMAYAIMQVPNTLGITVYTTPGLAVFRK